MRTVLRPCAAALAAGALSSCVTFLVGYGHDVQAPPDDRAASASAALALSDGGVVLELHDLSGDFSKHDGYLVLRGDELEQGFSEAPVESSLRLPVPHLTIPRERVTREPPAEIRASTGALPVVPWEPWKGRGADRSRPDANSAPEPVAGASTVIHWTGDYRTGREEQRFALHVTRGERRLVILLGRQSPSTWLTAGMAAAVVADIVLIALLL